MSSDFRPNEFAEALGAFIRRFCSVDDQCLRLCSEHCAKLCQWNRAINLVGDLGLETLIQRHYAEGLYLASLLPSDAGVVADFGSGGGFPGVCIAAHRRDLSVVLIESRIKKAAFLMESTRGWDNVSAFCGEAERYAETVDTWVTRGVKPEAVLKCAASRSGEFEAALLVSTEDAARLGGSEGIGGRISRIEALPWRSDSSVLLIARAS